MSLCGGEEYYDPIEPKTQNTVMSLCGGDTEPEFLEPVSTRQITTFKTFTCLCGKIVRCFMCPKYSVYIRKTEPFNFQVEHYGRIVSGIWKKYDEKNFYLSGKSDIYKLPFIEKTGLKYYKLTGTELKDKYTISTIIMVCDYNCPSVVKCINELKKEFKEFVKNANEKEHEEDDIAYYNKLSKYKHINPKDYVVTITKDVCRMCNKDILYHRTCTKNKLLIGASFSYPPPNYQWRKEEFLCGTRFKNVPKIHMKGQYYLCTECFIAYK